MVTFTSIAVRYAEINRMGIAHHSNYLIWFEAGRTDYLKKAGIPYSKIEASGFFLPVSEIKCEFISPAKYEDEIVVVTRVSYMSCVKIKFEYRILNMANRKLLATGKTVHAWTGRSIKPLNIKKAAPEIYKLLVQSIETKKGFF